MNKFVEMFRHSPFQPLREHMVTVMHCVRLIRPMFAAVQANNREEVEKLTKDIFKSEHAADLIKDEIRQTIPKTFYLPVYRGDLLGYLKLQDDMADTAEDVAYLLTIKKLPLPGAISDQAISCVEGVLRVVELTEKVSIQFQETAEKGFPPERVESALAGVREVEKAEWEADRMQYKLAQALFALEQQVSAVDIMLWFKIFGELAKLANAAESIADRVRRMMTAR